MFTISPILQNWSMLILIILTGRENLIYLIASLQLPWSSIIMDKVVIWWSRTDIYSTVYNCRDSDNKVFRKISNNITCVTYNVLYIR